MKVIYTNQEAPKSFTKSIFLAGPTPRNPDEVESWRPDALQILKDKGFDGVVFVPENKDGVFKSNYDDQIEWEQKYLNMADCILFWVPRDLSLDKNNEMKMPAFTTNVEFGRWESSGKIVFGCPEDSEKNRYLKYYADKYNVSIGDTLTETIDSALDMLDDGAERTDGERYVPLMIWNTPSFQSWYLSQTNAGNRLDSAKLLWSFRPQYKTFVFSWILKVDVYIESEKRNKTNEFVLSRTDISSVFLFKKHSDLMESEVVLIKEFRSPAKTPDGFIRELPGGSSVKEYEDPKDIAAEEVYEETSFHINSERLKKHIARQLSGTFSAHKSYLYSAELTDEELRWFKSQDGIVHGKEEDTERTFIEVYSVKEILEKELTDWSTLGMILSVIYDS